MKGMITISISTSSKDSELCLSLVTESLKFKNTVPLCAAFSEFEEPMRLLHSLKVSVKVEALLVLQIQFRNQQSCFKFRCHKMCSVRISIPTINENTMTNCDVVSYHIILNLEIFGQKRSCNCMMNKNLE